MMTILLWTALAAPGLSDEKPKAIDPMLIAELEKIAQAWRKQSESIQTISAKGTRSYYYPKGGYNTMVEKPINGRDYPPEDVEYSGKPCEYAFDFANRKYRRFMGTSEYMLGSNATFDHIERWVVDTYNNGKFTTYQPRNKNDWSPKANWDILKSSGFAFDFQDLPLLWSCGFISNLMTNTNPKITRHILVPNEAKGIREIKRADAECFVLQYYEQTENQGAAPIYREFIIGRMPPYRVHECRVYDANNVYWHISVQYKLGRENVIQSSEFTHYASNRVISREQSLYEDVRYNVDFDEGAFDQAFPEGSLVKEPGVPGMQIVSNGQLIPYRENSPNVTRPRWWIWIVPVVGIILIRIFIIIRRKNSTL